MSKVNFKRLKNNPNDRAVRQVISAGSGHIRVLEPGREQLEEVLKLQESWTKADGEIHVDEIDMVRILFGLFSDVEGMEDLSDEEVQDILDNPSIALMNLRTAVESILIEVYSLIFAQARQGLLESNFNLESSAFNRETFSQMSSILERHTGKDMGDKLRQATDALLDAQQAETPEEHEELMKKSRELTEEMRAEKPLDEKQSATIYKFEGAKVEVTDGETSVEVDLEEKKKSEKPEERMDAYKTEIEKRRAAFADDGDVVKV